MKDQEDKQQTHMFPGLLAHIYHGCVTSQLGGTAELESLMSELSVCSMIKPLGRAWGHDRVPIFLEGTIYEFSTLSIIMQNTV